jgi:hypothetical protein
VQLTEAKIKRPADIYGDVKISRLPKLKIKSATNIGEDVCELEQARSRLNFNGGVLLIDGHRVRSYDELVKLAYDDAYKNREYIEVVLLPLIGGG